MVWDWLVLCWVLLASRMLGLRTTGLRMMDWRMTGLRMMDWMMMDWFHYVQYVHVSLVEEWIVDPGAHLCGYDLEQLDQSKELTRSMEDAVADLKSPWPWSCYPPAPRPPSACS